MGAFTFQVSETLLLFLAHTLRSVLLTTSTRDAKERWHNVQECLRLAATVRYGQPERELLNKVALTLFAAWETSENNGAPLSLPVERGNATLKCHAPPLMASPGCPS